MVTTILIRERIHYKIANPGHVRLVASDEYMRQLKPALCIFKLQKFLKCRLIMKITFGLVIGALDMLSTTLKCLLT